MIKCPFCHFENEEGALFCEQCKSDLSGVAPAVPMVAEAIPVVAEAEPMMAEPIMAEPMMAEPMMAEPIMAEPMMAEPFVAEAVPLEPIPLAAEPVVPLMELMPVSPPPPPAPPPPKPVAAAPVAPPPPPAPAPAPAAAPAAPAAPSAGIPAGAQPRLIVQRGQKRNVEYPIFEGLNYIGRADEKPVDIDLEDQEPPDRVWCSRQHAVISFEGTTLTIEDLNSANGTYVNRARIYPGQPRALVPNDVVQIGNVQLKVVV